jgi:hypothetical protein
MTLIYKTVPAKRKRQLKAKTDDCTLDRVRIAGAIAIGGIVPQMYRQELQLALKALNLGEARPLLRPPASADIGQRRWDNILSDVTKVFRRYGIPVRLRPLPGNLSSEWRALRDRIQHDLRLLRGLSALMHYGSARGVAPGEVTDQALTTFHR